MAWIKCTVGQGIFPDERIVGVETNKGRKHLYVSINKIRQSESSHQCQLEVIVLPDKIFNTTDVRRVVLPGVPIEGGAVVEINESNLAIG